MSLLAVSGLSLSFGETGIVKSISFAVNRGEMLAIAGESGSGKSLTALACLGLQPDNARVSGSVVFDGNEMLGADNAHWRAIRGKRIGMIFQEPMTALNPLHTIGRQIGETIRIHAPQAQHVTAQILALLEQVGLGDFKDRLDAYPHQLSGGERQRVMIAMAIANKPDLLIADEPTTAVDVTLQLKILTLLKDLQKTMPMAILFITHDLTLIKTFADRVAIMSHGEIVEQGKVADVFAHPAHDYTRHLLGSAPKGTPLPYAADAQPIMACENLKVYFPAKKNLLGRTVAFKKAVDGLSITIPEKSSIGIVGESGSGKSTLGFALLRLIKSEGRIVFMGNPISDLQTKALRPLRRDMQVVFQDPYSSLNPRMNIGAIIEEGLLVHFPGQTPAQRTAAVAAILADVGLPESIRQRYPHEFSGGQRQRISIARAMVLKPRFVVLDEPTSALDLSVQGQIIDLLKSLQAKYGLTMMFISHDLRVIKAISHHIIVMRAGVIVEQNDAATLFSAPKHEYTRALLNAAFLKEDSYGIH